MDEDEEYAGLKHIADSVGYLRKALLKQSFTDRETFHLVRDFFYALVNRIEDQPEDE